MTWFLLALIAPALWALVGHIDKFIINKYFQGKGIGSLVIFTGLSGFIFSLFILLFNFSAIKITLTDAIIIACSGALLIASYIPYLRAMEKEEASLIVALFQMIPVFGYFLGLIFLHEQLSLLQIVGSSLIIIGVVVITLDFSQNIKIKLKPLLFMVLSSFMIAFNVLLFKIVALEANFWGTVFWEYIGAAIFSLFLFFGITIYRRQFLGMIKKSRMVMAVNCFGELLGIGAKLISNFVSLIVPIVLVLIVNSFQPVFSLLYGIIFTLFISKIYKENIDKKLLLQKGVAIFIIVFGSYLLFK